MLIAKGRVELDTTVSAFRTLTLRHGIHEEPVDGEVAISAAELPESHADPSYRMVVATAVLRGLTLVTADEFLLRWKVRGLRLRTRPPDACNGRDRVRNGASGKRLR
jgi:PIN domain nuclease of toxin-antitoxin system